MGPIRKISSYDLEPTADHIEEPRARMFPSESLNHDVLLPHRGTPALRAPGTVPEVVVLEDDTLGEQLGTDPVEVADDEPDRRRLVRAGVVGGGVDPELGSGYLVQQLLVVRVDRFQPEDL